MNIFVKAFLIYTIFFIRLGNTVFRLNSNNTITIVFNSLFVEGFVGPLRTLFLLLMYDNLFSAIKFVWLDLFRLSNPYSALFFTYYINQLIIMNL